MMMTYETLSDIFKSIDATRGRLFERTASLSGGQASARADDDGWTVAEIIEHLALVEKQIVRLSTLMLMKAETEGVKANASGQISPVSLDRIAERAGREKYQAPETARPVGLPMAESIALMCESREALQKLLPRLEVTDLSTVRYPHPVFGPLNLYEWLVMIGVHEERHLQQIDAILSE